jgi:hypothetical protein
MRQTGKVTTKEVENKGKKSVTKLKMGQPDDDFGAVPQIPIPQPEMTQPAPQEMEEDTQEDIQEDMMEQEVE